MRHLIWLAVLVSFTQMPVANAQSQMPPQQGAYTTSPRASTQGGGNMTTGENCGTPETPKPCPPLPRHPLPYYPGDRPSKG